MPDDLSMAEVERIAALARLTLTADEKALFAAQLARILEYASQVAEIEASDVPPMAAVTGDAPSERPDSRRPSLSRERTLSNAPDAASGLFRVPKVLGDA